MPDIKFDPQKGHQAAEMLAAVCNGDAQTCVVELYQIVKSMGEGNPVVDAPIASLKKIESYFNEEFVPYANKVKDHFMEYAELSELILKTQAAATKAGEAMGQVEDSTYNAAKVL